MSEETGPLELMATLTVPTPLTIDVDRKPAVPQASLTRAEEATLIIHGVVRDLKLHRALERT